MVRRLRASRQKPFMELTAHPRIMVDPKKQSVYYVVMVTTKFKSFADAKAKDPESIAAHIARSKKLHEEGTLMMSGAFLDNPGEPLSTMGVLTSREAAEDYIKNDPFTLRGMIAKHTIREWANMFA